MIEIREALVVAQDALKYCRETSCGAKTVKIDEALAAIEAALAAPAPESVAWVDVQHREEGPYEFHGIALLPKGPHHLYIAPPDTAAEIAKLQGALERLHETNAKCWTTTPKEES